MKVNRSTFEAEAQLLILTVEASWFILHELLNQALII